MLGRDLRALPKASGSRRSAATIPVRARRRAKEIETECTRRTDSLVRDMRFRLLSFVVLCSVTSLFGAVEKPFNFYETPGKLPKQVVPTKYSIRVVPNIENFTFAGSEMVKLSVHSATRQLVLNALELGIQTASVDGEELAASAIGIDKENELLTLTLPSELV